MNKTNVKANPSTTHRHDTPNNKTHIIKFRVTAEEKTSLELTCKLLNLSLSTFIRCAMRRLANSAIAKLEHMTDADFDGQRFDFTGE